MKRLWHCPPGIGVGAGKAYPKIHLGVEAWRADIVDVSETGQKSSRNDDEGASF